MINCAFTGNFAGNGGAVFNKESSSPRFINCVVSGNACEALGGGFHNARFCSPVLINCTLTGNSAGIRGGTIAGMAHRVWGCPHLIAALELACRISVGQPVASLENFDPAYITQELSVPVEKAGRIILLEDALAALWAHYASTED